MDLKRRGFLAAGSAALLAPRLGWAQANAYEADLYEKAKKEGELTWYIAHLTSETAERYGRTFTAAYPGIKVNVVRTTAQVTFQRVNQDLQSNTPNCDVFASTDLGHFVSLKERKLFMAYEPRNAAGFDKRFQNFDPDKTFHVTGGAIISLLYNTDKVPADQAPKRWTDLLDPKWRGQVSVGHPGFSGFVGTWVVQMNKLYGWDYFEKLAKNKPQVGRSITDTITALSSGERRVAAGSASTALLQASRGNPLGVSYPEEGSVLIILPTAIMATSRRPNAAKLFLEWLYGPEPAAIAAEEWAAPLRGGVALKPGVVPISEMKTINPTVEEIVKGIPTLAEQWRETFGI